MTNLDKENSRICLAIISLFSLFPMGHYNELGWLVHASSIGKHRVKKRTYLRGRLCFDILKNMAQNKKKRTYLRGRFCFHILKSMAQNKNEYLQNVQYVRLRIISALQVVEYQEKYGLSQS